MVNLVKAVHSAKYKVVVAVDDPSFSLSSFSELISSLGDSVVGFKVGLPYIMHYGVRQLKRVVEESPHIYYLADLKLADSADIMVRAARVTRTAGFNGLVAHVVVGIAGALDALAREVRSSNMDLVLQTTLVNPGSISMIDRLLPEIFNVVNAIDPNGLIVPANKAYLIRELRDRFGWRHVILSSDIMVYNILPGEGLCAGADAEVVGRTLLTAPNPRQALEDLVAKQEEVLRKVGQSCLSRSR